ncbi:MAG TPA: hypothetical protein VK572_05575 [Burkholderiales bacterium]|nr:hypothetical protein [Burkholderiales bacterium]
MRKREEAKPAPAAATPDARRPVGVQRQTQTIQAPAAAPVPGASGLRESAPAVPSADAVSGIASRIAAPEAERTPEKWLEDIRQLRAQGKTAEAERELAEFRKRYPDYRLPEDFR